MFVPGFNPSFRTDLPRSGADGAGSRLYAGLASSARTLADMAASCPGASLTIGSLLRMACNAENLFSTVMQDAAKTFFCHNQAFFRAARATQGARSSWRRMSFSDFHAMASEFEDMDDGFEDFGRQRQGSGSGPGSGSGSGDHPQDNHAFEAAAEEFAAFMRNRRKRSITPEGLWHLAGSGFPGMCDLLSDPSRLIPWVESQLDFEMHALMQDFAEEEALEQALADRHGQRRSAPRARPAPAGPAWSGPVIVELPPDDPLPLPYIPGPRPAVHQVDHRQEEIRVQNLRQHIIQLDVMRDEILKDQIVLDEQLRQQERRLDDIRRETQQKEDDDR